MIKLYSVKKTERILAEYDGWIETVSKRYAIPSTMIKAVLRKEIADIDLLDPAADLLVRLCYLRRRLFGRGTVKRRGILGKRDSSTGYAQIFAYVAINAANYALEYGLDDAAGLGLPEDRRLDGTNEDDLHAMWLRLKRDSRFNIQMGALNLISAAEEMNGHTNFARYTPEELQRTFTRYNAKTDHVTAYGKEVYGYYLKYGGHGGTKMNAEKRLTILHLDDCPYCHKARRALGELCEENPTYRGVAVEWIEEGRESDAAGHYTDYYYVPTIYAGGQKLYEAHPGDDYDKIKSEVKAALDAVV